MKSDNGFHNFYCSPISNSLNNQILADGPKSVENKVVNNDVRFIRLR